MAQRVTRTKSKRAVDINLYFDSIALEVRRVHFCAVTRHLLFELLEDNNLPTTIAEVITLAASRGMTVFATATHLVFRRLMKPMSDSSEITRASGDVLCDICSFTYKEHPYDAAPNDFLNVLCNGRRVKL